jgi:hypothetical protein
MPLSGAPLLGVVALWGAVGGVVVVGLVLLLLIVVVVVRCVVEGDWAPPALPLSLSEPQAPNSSAAAIAVTDAIRFIALMIAKRTDSLATLPANCAIRVRRRRPSPALASGTNGAERIRGFECDRLA